MLVLRNFWEAVWFKKSTQAFFCFFTNLDCSSSPFLIISALRLTSLASATCTFLKFEKSLTTSS